MHLLAGLEDSGVSVLTVEKMLLGLKIWYQAFPFKCFLSENKKSDSMQHALSLFFISSFKALDVFILPITHGTWLRRTC